MSTSRWLNVRHPQPGATVRLVCLPWSGGGSQWYANWGKLAPPRVEVVGITFAQRESRFKDPPCNNMAELAETIATEIHTNLSDKPIALFGHSFGISTSFEIARCLVEKFGTIPVYMFFSGHYAPHSKMRKQVRADDDDCPWHMLSDEDLIERVRRLGGTPASLLADKDFMTSIFLPPFRADLKIAAEHTCTYDPSTSSGPPLTCPVATVNGEEDMDFKVEEFSEVTSGQCRSFTLPGGHFYLTNAATSQKLMDIIAEELNSLT